MVKSKSTTDAETVKAGKFSAKDFAALQVENNELKKENALLRTQIDCYKASLSPDSAWSAKKVYAHFLDKATDWICFIVCASFDTTLPQL